MAHITSLPVIDPTTPPPAMPATREFHASRFSFLAASIAHSVAVNTPAAKENHIAGLPSVRPIARKSENPTAPFLEDIESGYHAAAHVP